MSMPGIAPWSMPLLARSGLERAVAGLRVGRFAGVLVAGFVRVTGLVGFFLVGALIFMPGMFIGIPPIACALAGAARTSMAVAASTETIRVKPSRPA